MPGEFDQFDGACTAVARKPGWPRLHFLRHRCGPPLISAASASEGAGVNNTFHHNGLFSQGCWFRKRRFILIPPRFLRRKPLHSPCTLNAKRLCVPLLKDI
ncbi:hypothetical protein SKAU_G00394390 [Synaphobranchus kaupii]|uniref:Uncharacterized protein n=1 Tax=Synaphobranchus kaupii TaxID=118154 RepID=A0A9Q1EC92_SYNKA|nr:hypothetical protein SKAU_G00394390 [Synaphobranchus kaupii]